MALRGHSPGLEGLAQACLEENANSFYEDLPNRSPLESIQHFCRSHQAFQRLTWTQGIAAAAAAATASYEECAEVLLPLVEHLSRDHEAEIRTAVVKQMYGLGAALYGKEAERSMRDIEATLLVCAQQCALDDDDEVSQPAILAFQQLVQLLPPARATAASKRAVDRLESQGTDDGTLAAVRLLAHTVRFWTPEALRRHVPRYVSRWAGHRDFSVREAIATCISLIAPPLQLRLCHQVLLPVQYQLSKDQNWRVRRAAALDLPRVAGALHKHAEQGQGLPAAASAASGASRKGIPFTSSSGGSSGGGWQQLQHQLREHGLQQDGGVHEAAFCLCSNKVSSCLGSQRGLGSDSGMHSVSTSNLLAAAASAGGVPQRNRSFSSLQRSPATSAQIMTKHPMHSSLIMDGLLSSSAAAHSAPGSPTNSTSCGGGGLLACQDSFEEQQQRSSEHQQHHQQQQLQHQQQQQQREHHDMHNSHAHHEQQQQQEQQSMCLLEQAQPLLHDCWCALRQCMELLTADSSHWVKVAALSGLGPFLLQVPHCQLGQLLLGRFTSMAGSTVVIYEVSVALACAQAFGKLAVLLGPERWPDMRDAWHALQSSRDPQVLCELVACLPSLTAALGPVLTQQEVVPALAGLLQAHLGWIGAQLVAVMGELLEELPAGGQELLLKALPQLAASAGERSRLWRLRRDLAQQLGRMAAAAGPEAVENSLWPTAMSLCQDPVAAVRAAAAGQVGPILATLPAGVLQQQLSSCWGGGSGGGGTSSGSTALCGACCGGSDSSGGASSSSGDGAAVAAAVPAGSAVQACTGDAAAAAAACRSVSDADCRSNTHSSSSSGDDCNGDSCGSSRPLGGDGSSNSDAGLAPLAGDRTAGRRRKQQGVRFMDPEAPQVRNADILAATGPSPSPSTSTSTSSRFGGGHGSFAGLGAGHGRSSSSSSSNTNMHSSNRGMCTAGDYDMELELPSALAPASSSCFGSSSHDNGSDEECAAGSGGSSSSSTCGGLGSSSSGSSSREGSPSGHAEGVCGGSCSGSDVDAGSESGSDGDDDEGRRQEASSRSPRKEQLHSSGGSEQETAVDAAAAAASSCHGDELHDQPWHSSAAQQPAVLDDHDHGHHQQQHDVAATLAARAHTGTPEPFSVDGYYTPSPSQLHPAQLQPRQAMHPAMMPVGMLPSQAAAGALSSAPRAVPTPSSTSRGRQQQRTRSTGDLLRMVASVNSASAAGGLCGEAGAAGDADPHHQQVPGVTAPQQQKRHHHHHQRSSGAGVSLASSLPVESSRGGLLGGSSSSSSEDEGDDEGGRHRRRHHNGRAAASRLRCCLPLPVDAAPHQYLPCLVQYYGCSASYQERQLFVPLVMGLLSACHDILSCSQQAVLLDRLEALAHDSVPGVRYAVAVALAEVRAQATALNSSPGHGQQQQEQLQGQERLQNGWEKEQQHAELPQEQQQHSMHQPSPEQKGSHQEPQHEHQQPSLQLQHSSGSPGAHQVQQAEVAGATAGRGHHHSDTSARPAKGEGSRSQDQNQQEGSRVNPPAAVTASTAPSGVPKGAHPLLGYQAYVQQLAQRSSVPMRGISGGNSNGAGYGSTGSSGGSNGRNSASFGSSHGACASSSAASAPISIVLTRPSAAAPVTGSSSGGSRVGDGAGRQASSSAPVTPSFLDGGAASSISSRRAKPPLPAAAPSPSQGARSRRSDPLGGQQQQQHTRSATRLAAAVGEAGGAAPAATAAALSPDGAKGVDAKGAADKGKGWLDKLENCQQLERLMHMVALTTGPAC